MQTFHNPDRFMSDLRQILSQGRKRIGLLVGAGAPLSIRIDANGRLSPDGHPLMPGMEALTNAAVEALTPEQAVAARAILHDLGAKANIETLLSKTRLFHQALGATLVNGLNASGYFELGASICNSVGKVVGARLPSERNAYSELISWIGGTDRTYAVEIFTTNYDLLFEEAFERARKPYFDGFTGGSSPFFDPVTVASNDLPPRWSRLWKLHGSIGWALESEGVVRGRGREATQLVYPDHLKYELTQKQPYSALFERLKRFLLTPDTLLLAIGFSFRDPHVCAVLDEALAMNSNAAVFAFQYQSLNAEAPSCKLALDHPNMSVYALDGAVVSGVPGQWRLGETQKNWEDIRASFWGSKTPSDSPSFLLGNFAHFTRFCALAQASDFSRPTAEIDAESTLSAVTPEEAA